MSLALPKFKKGDMTEVEIPCPLTIELVMWNKQHITK